MAGTLTASAYSASRADGRGLHAGSFERLVRWQAAGTTISTSMTLYVMPLPIGMIVTEVKVWGDPGAGSATVTVTDVQGTTYITNTAVTAAAFLNVAPGAMGTRVSLSDGTTPYTEVLKAILTAGTATTTMSLNFYVRGYMEPA